MDGFTKRTKEKMEKIEAVAVSMLPLEMIDIKIADIAKQANVSQVTIYNYYGSKENLLKIAVKRLTEEQIQLFEETIHGELPFEDKLKQITLHKKQGAQMMNLNMYKELAQSDPDFYSYTMRLNSEKTIPLLMKLIRDGREGGYIRSSIRDETLLFYVNIMGQAFMQLDQLGHHSNEYEQLVEDCLNMFLYGILNQR